jgi:hypothetical protein
MSGVSGGPCVDRHGVALRVGDRVTVACTVTAIREADCCVHLQLRASERRAVVLAIDYFTAYADQIEKQPEPPERTDRWA